MKIVEVRVVTHNSPGNPVVVVITDDGKSSWCERNFKGSGWDAEMFAAGVREGIAWMERINAATNQTD